jgi:hypothetical protein
VFLAKQEKTEDEYKLIGGKNIALASLFNDVTPFLTKWENESSEFEGTATSPSAILFYFHSIWSFADG